MRIPKTFYILTLAACLAGYGYWLNSQKKPPPTPEKGWQFAINYDIEDAFCSQVARDIERFKESPSTFRRVSYNTMLARAESVVRAGVGQLSQLQKIPDDFPRSYTVSEKKEKFIMCKFDLEAWLKLPPLVDESQVALPQEVRRTQESKGSVRKEIALAANKRLALVIGNAAYTNRPLRNSVNDANDISRALEILGFDVINLRNGNLQQMRESIVTFGERLVNYDVGLVYYSGHGVEVGGRNFLVPITNTLISEDEVADRAIDASLIVEKLSQAKKRINILILDACRDNPLRSRNRSSSNGLTSIDAPVGTLVAFSTSPGKVAEDGAGRNSPYTKRLIENMLKPNIPVERVFKETRESVIEETRGRQIPWESTSLRGDFYFKQ